MICRIQEEVDQTKSGSTIEFSKRRAVLAKKNIIIWPQNKANKISNKRRKTIKHAV